MTWILTSTGKHFDFADPQPEQIDIIDIANGLAKQCRFSGQCREFYSVAQHSVLVSRLVPSALAMEGLLHDATEAYCQDIPTPLKDLLPDYRAIERRVQEVIDAKFGLKQTPERADSIYKADRWILADERRDLMPADGTPWRSLAGVPSLGTRIVPNDDKTAFWDFIARFNFLTSGRRSLK